MGIGVVEAPRGTLFHHYKVDKDGLMTWANLIVATGNNNLAMNRGVLQVAKRFIPCPDNGSEECKNFIFAKEKIPEGALNRIEAVIRAFDPCLSCSTHALGQIALQIQLIGSDGRVLDEVERL